MRILGIDPGSNATGFGVVDHSQGTLNAVAYGVIRPPKGAPLFERLGVLDESIREVLEQHQPDQVAVEEVFVALNPRSALILGQARGAILAGVASFRVPVHEYAPRMVKQAVVGAGGAVKSQVQAMVQRMLGLGECPPLDASDALAVAICHAHSGRLQQLGVRSSRRRSGSRSNFVVRRAR